MASIKVVTQPERLRTPLFIHQRANILRMEILEKNKRVQLNASDYMDANIGILGDPPGTGKTKTIIGLICRDKMKWGGPLIEQESQLCSNLDGSIRITRRESFGRIQTTLIVTPLSIIGQWESELKESNLTYKLVKDRASIHGIESCEVVVCTINMYNILVEKYQDVVFKRFVYDEMDSAYIANMARIKAGFLWFVSATFHTVLDGINRSRKVHFMKQLFMNIIGQYTADRMLETITVQSTDRERALRPVPMDYESKYYNVNRAPVVEALHQYMDRTLVEMIDAGNIRAAIQHLGGDEDDSNIADLLRTRAERDVHEAERKVAEYKGRQQEEWTDRLAKAQHKLRNIGQKISEIEMGDCVLCSMEMKYPTLIGCCQNITCARCIGQWIEEKNTCPFCRIQSPRITHLRQYTPGADTRSGDLKIPRPQTKFDHLVNVARPGTKVLVFSSHENQFKEIATELKSHNITYGLLSGAVSRRQEILDGFTKGNLQVLILNSRVNGAGLNLQVSTDIVMWHSMPAPLTSQLIGRALRYGIDHKLVVHKFFPEEEDGREDPPKRKRRARRGEDE